MNYNQNYEKLIEISTQRKEKDSHEKREQDSDSDIYRLTNNETIDDDKRFHHTHQNTKGVIGNYLQ